jgi:hypothetical protein
MASGSGFLAIWSDVDRGAETDYLHWLTREHTAERLSVPGFLGVRVFRARLPEHCRYFILYRLADPGVVGSEPYLARLNAPSEWSRRIMPILGNFVRGGGRVVAEAGRGEGAMVVPIVCEHSEVAAATAALGSLAALDRVVSARLFEVEQRKTAIATKEKAMRPKDASFPALLLVEALADPALDAAIAALRTTIRMTAPPVRYDQAFALDRDEVVPARSSMAP